MESGMDAKVEFSLAVYVIRSGKRRWASVQTP